MQVFHSTPLVHQTNNAVPSLEFAESSRMFLTKVELVHFIHALLLVELVKKEQQLEHANLAHLELFLM
jgi:hypothetical protein